MAKKYDPKEFAPTIQPGGIRKFIGQVLGTLVLLAFGLGMLAIIKLSLGVLF